MPAWPTWQHWKSEQRRYNPSQTFFFWCTACYIRSSSSILGYPLSLNQVHNKIQIYKSWRPYDSISRQHFNISSLQELERWSESTITRLYNKLIEYKVPGWNRSYIFLYSLQEFWTNSEYENNQLTAFESKFRTNSTNYSTGHASGQDITYSPISYLPGWQTEPHYVVEKEKGWLFSTLCTSYVAQTAGIDTGTQQKTSQ